MIEVKDIRIGDVLVTKPYSKEYFYILLEVLPHDKSLFFGWTKCKLLNIEDLTISIATWPSKLPRFWKILTTND